MLKFGIACVTACLLSTQAIAASPSSKLAQQGEKPSQVNTNGGFDFKARDNGQHTGWCKGEGHLSRPGNQASGHRNHWDCYTDIDDICANNPNDPMCN